MATIASILANSVGGVLWQNGIELFDDFLGF